MMQGVIIVGHVCKQTNNYCQIRQTVCGQCGVVFSVKFFMELNFTSEDETFGLLGFEGTGLELIEYSLDARKRILLTKLGLFLGFGIMVLSWVFLVSVVFLLVAIVLTCLLFI